MAKRLIKQYVAIVLLIVFCASVVSASEGRHFKKLAPERDSTEPRAPKKVALESHRDEGDCPLKTQCKNGVAAEGKACKCVCNEGWDGLLCDVCIRCGENGKPNPECTACECFPPYSGEKCEDVDDIVEVATQFLLGTELFDWLKQSASGTQITAPSAEGRSVFIMEMNMDVLKGDNMEDVAVDLETTCDAVLGQYVQGNYYYVEVDKENFELVAGKEYVKSIAPITPKNKISRDILNLETTASQVQTAYNNLKSAAEAIGLSLEAYLDRLEDSTAHVTASQNESEEQTDVGDQSVGEIDIEIPDRENSAEKSDRFNPSKMVTLEAVLCDDNPFDEPEHSMAMLRQWAEDWKAAAIKAGVTKVEVAGEPSTSGIRFDVPLKEAKKLADVLAKQSIVVSVTYEQEQVPMNIHGRRTIQGQNDVLRAAPVSEPLYTAGLKGSGEIISNIDWAPDVRHSMLKNANGESVNPKSVTVKGLSVTFDTAPTAERTVFVKILRLKPLAFTSGDEPTLYKKDPATITPDDTSEHSVVIKRGQKTATFDVEWKFEHADLSTELGLGGLNSYGDLELSVRVTGDVTKVYRVTTFKNTLTMVPLSGSSNDENLKDSAGVDKGTVKVHLALGDQSGVRKIMRYFAKHNNFKYHEHGSHTAATNAGIASDADAEINRFRSGAPEAKLVLGEMQSKPASSDQMILMGYKSGARVSSNSYGVPPPGKPAVGNVWNNAVSTYGPKARQHDLMVYENKDYVICFAAGNDGRVNNIFAKGEKTLGSDTQTSKNLILVGAGVSNTESWEEAWKYSPTTCPEYAGAKTQTCQANIESKAALKSVEQTADFSSRGPCADAGRIKPDILAPGNTIVSAREDALGKYDADTAILSQGEYAFQYHFDETVEFSQTTQYRSQYTFDFEMRGRIKIEFKYQAMIGNARNKKFKVLLNSKGKGATASELRAADGWTQLEEVTLPGNLAWTDYSREFELDHMQARVGIMQKLTGGAPYTSRERFRIKDFKIILVRGGPPHVAMDANVGITNAPRLTPPFTASWTFDGNDEARTFDTKELDMRKPTRILLTYKAGATGNNGAAGKKIKVQSKIPGGGWTDVKEITLAGDVNWHTEAVDVPGTAGANGMKKQIRILQANVARKPYTLFYPRYNSMVLDMQLEVLAQDVQSYDNPLPSKGIAPIAPATDINGRRHTSSFKFVGNGDKEFVTRKYDTRQPLRVTIRYQGAANKHIFLDAKNTTDVWEEVEDITIADTNEHIVEIEVKNDESTQLRLRGDADVNIRAFSLDLGTWHSTLVAISGTSMATPTVAAGASLVREYYKKGFYPVGKESGINAFLPSAALVKATILNSGQKIANPRIAGYPGFEQGFGRMALDKTLYINGKSAHKVVVNKMELPLVKNEAHSFDVQVKDAADDFKVTVAWTDPPLPSIIPVIGAFGSQQHAVISDLELLVTPVTSAGVEFDRNILGSTIRGVAANPVPYSELDATKPYPYTLSTFDFGADNNIQKRKVMMKEYDMRQKTLVSFWAAPLDNEAKLKKVELHLKKGNNAFAKIYECQLSNVVNQEKYCSFEVDAQHAKAKLLLQQVVQSGTPRNNKEKIRIRDFHIHFDHWGNEAVYKSEFSGGWDTVNNEPIEAGVKQIRSNNNVEQVHFKARANNDKFRVTVWAKRLAGGDYKEQDYALVATAKDLEVVSPLYKVYIALDNPRSGRVCEVLMKHNNVEVKRRFPCPNEEHIFEMRPLKKFAGPPEVTVKVKDMHQSCATTVAKMHVLSVSDKKLYEKKACTIDIDEKSAGLLTGKRLMTTTCTTKAPAKAKYRYKVFVLSDPLENEGRKVPLTVKVTLWDATPASKAIEVSPRASFNNGDALVSYESTEEENSGLAATLTHVQLQSTAALGAAPEWRVGGVLVYDAKNEKTYYAEVNQDVDTPTAKIALTETLNF